MAPFKVLIPNYTSETTINLLSQPPPIAGCMDSTSSSYNPNANLSNGQCTYPVSLCSRYEFLSRYLLSSLRKWTV